MVVSTLNLVKTVIASGEHVIHFLGQ